MSATRSLFVWVREDGEPPCLLAPGDAPRGPGSVYEVTGARSRAEACRLVSVAKSPEPPTKPRARWGAWADAKDAVRLVDAEELT